MEFVVTFYSHFDGILFKKEFEKKDIEVKLGPVPRRLSSSCGTAAFFSTKRAVAEKALEGLSGISIEQIVLSSGEAYEVLYDFR